LAPEHHKHYELLFIMTHNVHGGKKACSTSSRITYVCRAGQNRMYTPYMTVYLVISLPKIPYTNRLYMVLANPTYVPKGEAPCEMRYLKIVTIGNTYALCFIIHAGGRRRVPLHCIRAQGRCAVRVRRPQAWAHSLGSYSTWGALIMGTVQIVRPCSGL
jgi:hypothetical protein